MVRGSEGRRRRISDVEKEKKRRHRESGNIEIVLCAARLHNNNTVTQYY